MTFHLVGIIGMINISNSPWVHSVGSEGNYENLLTSDYMSRLNVEFQKFGVMGRTILFSSGPDGVGCDGYVSKKMNLTKTVQFFPL